MAKVVVLLADYVAQIERQKIKNDKVTPDKIRSVLSGLVLKDDLVGRFGPAVNSGRSMLFYGAPGDGKSQMSNALSKCFEQDVYFPYAIEASGHVISFFDPSIHIPVDDPSRAQSGDSARASLRQSEPDPRWIKCKRPVAVTDGPGTIRFRVGARRGTVPVDPVDVVDTLGAGDVFHGAWLAHVGRHGLDGFERGLRFAAGIAGFSCRFSGAHIWAEHL